MDSNEGKTILRNNEQIIPIQLNEFYNLFQNPKNNSSMQQDSIEYSQFQPKYNTAIQTQQRLNATTSPYESPYNNLNTTTQEESQQQGQAFYTDIAQLQDNLKQKLNSRGQSLPKKKIFFPVLQTMKGRFDLKRKIIKENNQITKQQNNSFSYCYPMEEKMKKKKISNISTYMLGGYDIIDYSQTINLLHKKLLKKITLNK